MVLVAAMKSKQSAQTLKRLDVFQIESKQNEKITFSDVLCISVNQYYRKFIACINLKINFDIMRSGLIILEATHIHFHVSHDDVRLLHCRRGLHILLDMLLKLPKFGIKAVDYSTQRDF